MTKGMQNHVLFLMRRHVWRIVSTAMHMVAITPPAIEGVYGHSTYSGRASVAIGIVGKIFTCDS